MPAREPHREGRVEVIFADLPRVFAHALQEREGTFHKTAAAMLVLPAIVNNPTAQREAGEVYQLAKKALRNAAEEK